MRAGPWLALVSAIFAISGPAPAVRPPTSTGPFLPLSNADEIRAQSGCTCTFLVGGRRRSTDLLQLSGHILLSRTRAGLNSCPISEAQFRAMTGPGGSARCGGRRIAISSGPARQVGDDQAESAATVTVTRRGRTRVLHGTWACAC
jgi:hypothetical protein